MPSPVAEIPAADPLEAARHYAGRLAFETDCWDVHESLRTGAVDFVLIDVRGPRLYERSHVPGALNLPHGKITVSRMEAWPADTLFVVYCAGPHCNGTDRAALRLDVVAHQLAFGIPHVAADLVGVRVAWADARKDQDVADTPRVRIHADRAGRVVLQDDAVVHAVRSGDSMCASARA